MNEKGEGGGQLGGVCDTKSLLTDRALPYCFNKIWCQPDPFKLLEMWKSLNRIMKRKKKKKKNKEPNDIPSKNYYKQCI